jgi:EAL domain-containing protein (putative c-di-GMP-specific phosphodiesterase class I)/GGDEF domain-containing protein
MGREVPHSFAMKENVTQIREEAASQLRRVLAGREISIVFQPIFGFREGRIIGYEALVRGPSDSLVCAPMDLFGTAQQAGLAVELNVICIQEVLRAFARRRLEGSLFLNVSPQLIIQRGFEQERAARFMRSLGLDAKNVVIELTEDYPTVDFRFVQESLMLYRSMGFRVAIDDLGEGFASLRLWSELRPEFVKADKHFVRGISIDPVKLQFLRAIQHIAESSGSQVIAEGIEGPEDFRVAKDIGIACGQGYFIGRPAEAPNSRLCAEAEAAYMDKRVPVVAPARLRAGREPTAADLVRSVAPIDAAQSIAAALERFTASSGVTAIPVTAEDGELRGVVSRTQVELIAASPECDRLLARQCGDVLDEAPIRVEASLDLGGLTALLVESDARRLADGFVIVSGGRYLGMGTGADVMRALQSSRVLAARYTNPLTELPGQVPINEHVERLLESRCRFTAWFVEVDQMRGLNDGAGFEKGDALIHATARLLESVCRPGLDFVGHISGSRFALLVQSEDWAERARHALELFPEVVATQVPRAVADRGYFIMRTREGRDHVRPLPKLGIGILPVLPGVFETRHEVMAAAKHAAQRALAQPSSAMYVDENAANAYPQSVLF